MKVGNRLLVLLLLFLVGNLLGGLFFVLIGWFSGLNFGEVQGLLDGTTEMSDPGMLRWSLFFQAFAVFILPGLLFIFLFYPGRKLAYLDIALPPKLLTLLLAGVFLFASLPLVNLMFQANTMIALPEWMRSMEQNALGIMQSLLEMDHFGIFLLNLLLIAVLPGIGEELLFRGILQKQLAILFRNPIAGIWVAAILFSAAHFQFEGFLPRIALGLVLGYLYYWTRNLWVPIFVHFLNNGFQIGYLYFTGVDLSAVDVHDGPKITWWYLLAAIVIMYFISEHLRKHRHV